MALEKSALWNSIYLEMKKSTYSVKAGTVLPRSERS
jgi:hypothetical protein